MRRLLQVLALLPAGTAAAAEGDLETAPVRFQHEERAFPDFEVDTDWQPPGSPIQVRFIFNLGGGLEADLPGRSDLSWDPLEALFVGDEGAGRFSMDLGVELQAMLRLGLDLPGGGRLDWEGDVPFVPSFDLRLADETSFTPFLLEGSAERPAALSDETDRMAVYQYDITDALVPIPGIGGGIGVDVQGSLDASLSGNRIVLGDIWETREEGVPIRILPSGEATIATNAGYEATVSYDGAITLYPYVFVEVPGADWELDLLDIPIPLESDDLWVFDPQAIEWVLPDVHVSPTALDFGDVQVGRSAEMRLAIDNDGRHRLLVSIDTPPDFEVSREDLELFAEAGTMVTVTFAPSVVGPVEDTLLLATNDPDSPELEIALTGNGLEGEIDAGPDDPDAGSDAGEARGNVRHQGGCGCATVGDVGSPFAAALALFARPRARRRARARARAPGGATASRRLR